MSAPNRDEMLSMIMSLEGVGRDAGVEKLRQAMLAKHPPEKVEAFLGASLLHVLSSITVGDLLALAAAGERD